MPIDPKGTAPGLSSQPEEPKQVHMKCKNPNCDSILAIEINIPGAPSGQHLYRCAKCHLTRGIRVGGGVDLG